MPNESPDWEKFPTDRVSRKRLLDEAGKHTAEKVAPLELSWGAANSPLKESPLYPRGWSFSNFFKEVVPPEYENLQTYIEEALKGRRGNAVGIEFGGPGSELFAGFSEGFFKQTLGICLVDSRDLMSPDPRPRDKARNHEVISGNMFDSATYETLNERLHGGRVDVIFERLLGGIDLVPREPHMIGSTLQNWYKLLNEGGVLFAQVPEDFSNFVYALQLKLRSENVKGLEISAARNKALSSFSSFALRLRKLQNAPGDLSLLDLRTTTAISQHRRSMRP